MSCWYLGCREKEWEWLSAALGRGKALVAVRTLNERSEQRAGKLASRFVGV